MSKECGHGTFRGLGCWMCENQVLNETRAERDALKDALSESHAQQIATENRVLDLQAKLAVMREALDAFMRQVDEFVQGKWDEMDWPAALGTLVDLAKGGRAALSSTSEAAREYTARIRAEVIEECAKEAERMVIEYDSVDALSVTPERARIACRIRALLKGTP